MNQRTPTDLATKTDATVLITGPTGSGKSRLAQEIHAGGARRHRPFITVNLATLHEGTLESELFGHERGAFTGAESRRQGRLEAANGGTVFLDEIGELPPRLQARLLEFLQTKTISPVGSNREVKLDVRVIAATNRDLKRSVASGEFRLDLFHRLRVISIELESIAERAADFDSFVHDCLEEICRGSGRTLLRISPEVADRLESHDWPGNFRELRNVLEYAVHSSSGPELIEADLPSWFGEKMPSGANPAGIPDFSAFSYAEAIAQFERNYLEQALRRSRGRVNRTARAIQMNKTTLIRRMRAYGLYDAQKAAPGAAIGVS